MRLRSRSSKRLWFCVTVLTFLLWHYSICQGPSLSTLNRLFFTLLSNLKQMYKVYSVNVAGLRIRRHSCSASVFLPFDPYMYRKTPIIIKGMKVLVSLLLFKITRKGMESPHLSAFRQYWRKGFCFILLCSY